jgi:hypothetical protein
MLDSNVESGPSGLQIDARIRQRDFKHEHHLPILNVPLERVCLSDLGKVGLGYEVSLCDAGRDDGKVQDAMFISVRQLTEEPQQRGQYRVGTIVGLEIGDYVAYRVRDTSEFRFSPIPEEFRLTSHEETGFVSFVGARTAGKMSDGIHGMIESVPQISEAISDHQAPSLEIRLRAGHHRTEVMLGRLFVAFIDDLVLATMEPSVNFRIDRFEMFGSPFKLCVDASEV